MATTYQADKRPKTKRRRRILWLIIILLILWILFFGWLWLRNSLKPKVTIKQANPITTKVTYNSKIKHYDEPDFGIDMPASWSAVPRPPHTYQSFTWQSSDRVTDGQQIEIYEDTIPINFAVNRALVVVGEVDRVSVDGAVSDNCSRYTKPTNGGPNRVGVPAKWQGIDFLCDQSNQQRDVVGTSSNDGVNTVILHSQNSSATHKFFFTYTDYASNPDYTLFYDALASLRMN